MSTTLSSSIEVMFVISAIIFSFVEIIQDCLIFNIDSNNKDKQMYKVQDNKDKNKAEKLANEFDYNSQKGKIPLGVIYQTQEPTLEEKWPQLSELMKKGVGWKNAA